MHRNDVHSSGAGDEESYTISIPAETLFDADARTNMWPETLTNNPVFKDQIDARKRLIDALNAIQSRITNPVLSFEELLHHKSIDEEQVADLYEALTSLLLDTSEYHRMILYVPFEYLLNSTYEPRTERLRVQAEEFRAAYMYTWNRLLYSHNVRANFVDGDVLETEKRTGDLQRVVKAAHLIPFLVQKGWISVDEVREIYDTRDDEVLRSSIADTFGVLCDLDLVDQDFLNRYGVSKVSKTVVEPLPIQPEALERVMEERLARVSVEDGDLTKKRQAWLAEVHRKNVIEETGNEVRQSLHHHLFTDEAVQRLLLPEAHVPSQLAFIEGVRKEVESVAVKDMDAALRVYKSFHSALQTLWQIQNSEIGRYLRQLFFRLHHLGVVDAETLHSLGLSVPHLGGPFSENLKHLDAETKEVERIIDVIRSNPDFKKYVYPVVMMYGSKLKGYGTNNADDDLGVFIKPTTPDDMRATVRDLLRSICDSESPKDPISEFWLTEDTSGLAVRDFDGHDRVLGDSISSHVLFGAAWHGDINSMRELYAKLLPSYFLKTDKVMFGCNVRDIHIECLEHDVLQYRLMHKGYERYYPSAGGIKTPHADAIDGSSAFWDSGYRAIATKLFVERVFLPKL